MALTSLSNVYLSNDINKFFNLSGRVTVNATLLFLENSYTSSVVVKRDIQKKLIEVIQARNNNIGKNKSIKGLVLTSLAETPPNLWAKLTG